MSSKDLPVEFDKICKICKRLRNEHEDWIATGEYAANVVCPTDEMDEQRRYKKLNWFEPMTNLDYLEYLYKNKQDLTNGSK